MLTCVYGSYIIHAANFQPIYVYYYLCNHGDELTFYRFLTGNYHESLSDAKAGKQFKPSYMKAIEIGKIWNPRFVAKLQLGTHPFFFFTERQFKKTHLGLFFAPPRTRERFGIKLWLCVLLTILREISVVLMSWKEGDGFIISHAGKSYRARLDDLLRSSTYNQKWSFLTAKLTN